MAKNLGNKKGFTLIEMLIVIVIIGILAAALIPRLTAVQGRARDTARVTALSQVGGAMGIYYTDNGKYPMIKDVNPAAAFATFTGGSTDMLIASGFIPAYISSIPRDPQAATVVKGIDYTAASVASTSTSSVSNPAYDSYTPVYKNGAAQQGFVLMADTETLNASNWIYDSTVSSTTNKGLTGSANGAINASMKYEDISVVGGTGYILNASTTNLSTKSAIDADYRYIYKN